MSRQYPPLLFCMALLIAGVLLLAGPAAAKNYGFETKDNDLSDSMLFQSDGSGLLSQKTNATWDAQLKLYSLVGEPVVSVRFRYEFSPQFTYVSLPVLDGSGKKFEVSLDAMPEQARKLLGLYNVTVRFHLRTHVHWPTSVYVEADVGDPGPSDGKTWSFNVPDSPNWDKFLMSGLDGSTYLSEADAKQVFAKGFDLIGAKVVSAHVTAFDLQNWYAKHSKWPEVDATIRAYNYLADAVSRSTGLKPPLLDRVDYNYASMSYNAAVDMFYYQDDKLRSVRKKLDKLMNLPDSFIPEDNPGPYETAIGEAPKLVSTTREYAKEWRSSELDPSTLKKGYPPKVDGGTAQEFTGRSKLYYFRSVVNDKDTYYLKLEFRCKEPYDTTTRSVKYISYTREGVPSAGKKGYIAGTEVTYGPYAGGAMDFSIIGGDLRLLGPIKPIVKDFYEKIQRMDPRCKLTPYRAQATIRRSPGSEVLDYCHDHIDKGDDGQQSICVKSDVPLQFSP